MNDKYRTPILATLMFLGQLGLIVTHSLGDISGTTHIYGLIGLGLALMYFVGRWTTNLDSIDKDIEMLEMCRATMEVHQATLQVLMEREQAESVMREVEQRVDGISFDWESLANEQAKFQ